jgi:hypothetical protein
VSWHTTGPGGLRYRFGNVAAVARSSCLGELWIVPRVTPLDCDDQAIETDELEFLGSLQPAIEAAGLPWRHLHFPTDPGDRSGIRMPLAHDADVRESLRDLGSVVAEFPHSIITALAAIAEEQFTVERLHVSLDVRWSLASADVPALVAWLNAPFGASAPFSVERLGEGGVDQGWYRAPSTMVGVFDRLARDDPARHLAAHALARAVLAGEEPWLGQPDDEYGATTWDRVLDDGRAGAVVLRPAEYPLLDRLARAFDVPVSVREMVFYLYGGDDVDLPPEEVATPEQVDTGMAFAGYMADIVAIWAADRLVPSGGERQITCGFHVGGDRATIEAAFIRAGVQIRPLDRLLAGEREPFQSLTEPARLAAMRDSAPDSPAYGYVLDGGAIPRPPDETTIGCLLLLLEAVALPDGGRERLDLVLRAAAAEHRATDVD